MLEGTLSEELKVKSGTYGMTCQIFVFRQPDEISLPQIFLTSKLNRQVKIKVYSREGILFWVLLIILQNLESSTSILY